MNWTFAVSCKYYEAPDLKKGATRVTVGTNADYSVYGLGLLDLHVTSPFDWGLALRLNSHLARLLNSRGLYIGPPRSENEEVPDGFNPFDYWSFRPPEQERAMSCLVNDVEPMRALAQRHEADFVMVIFPQLQQASPYDSNPEPQAVIEEWAAGVGIPVIDILEDVRGLPEDPRGLF